MAGSSIHPGEWIGFDLDGTLAEYHSGQGRIGDPIPSMVARVKAYLAEGREVRIVTARVASTSGDAAIQRKLVTEWCIENIGVLLKVQAEKDYRMARLYDDRAVEVINNTGKLVGEMLNELAAKAEGLTRGCDCEYDYRCGRCEDVLAVRELASRAKVLIQS